MKKKLTITGIFNDVFTNYEDKESSVTMIVDDELDCTCGESRCLIHEMPHNYILSDISKDLNNRSMTEHLNNAIKKINQNDYKNYFLTDNVVVSNQMVDKIFRELPKDMPYLEILALREHIKLI